MPHQVMAAASICRYSASLRRRNFGQPQNGAICRTSQAWRAAFMPDGEAIDGVPAQPLASLIANTGREQRSSHRDHFMARRVLRRHRAIIARPSSRPPLNSRPAKGMAARPESSSKNNVEEMSPERPRPWYRKLASQPNYEYHLVPPSVIATI